MPFKINISEKGKTFHIEAESEAIVGKTIGEAISGEDIDTRLSGYKLEITGASDIAGFPAFKEIEGQGSKRVLLKYGKGMKQSRPKGLRLKKTVRGNVISPNIVQINAVVKKSGEKKLEEIFPEQAKGKTKEKTEVSEAKAEETKTETKEEKKEKTEETKANIEEKK